jgi:hypothetical protein
MADPKDFSITICGLPTHEQLVAEIYYKEQFVGLISEEEGPAARRSSSPRQMELTRRRCRWRVSCRRLRKRAADSTAWDGRLAAVDVLSLRPLTTVSVCGR